MEVTGATGAAAYALRTEAAATRETLTRVARALVAYCAAPEIKSPLAAVAAVAARSLARGLWPDADGATQLLQLEGLVTEPLLAPLASVGATNLESLVRVTGPVAVSAASIDAATRKPHPFGQRLKAAAAAVAQPALEVRAATGVTQVGTGPGVAVLRIEVTEVAPSARGAGGVGAAWVPPPPPSSTAAAADAGGGGGKGKKKGGNAAATVAASALQQRAITDFIGPASSSGGSPSSGADADDAGGALLRPGPPPQQRNPFAGAPPASLVPGLEQTYTLAVTTADGSGGLAHWQPGITGPTTVTISVGRPTRGPLVQVCLLHAWAHGRDVRITFQPVYGFGPVPRGLGPGDSVLVRSLAEQRAAASNAATTAAAAASASTGGGSTLASASPASPADVAAAAPAPRPAPLFRPAQPRLPLSAPGAVSEVVSSGGGVNVTDADDVDGLDIAASREGAGDVGGGAQMVIDGDDYDVGGGGMGGGSLSGDDVDAAVDLAAYRAADAPAAEGQPPASPSSAAPTSTLQQGPADAASGMDDEQQPPTAAVEPSPSPLTVSACASPLPSDGEGTSSTSGGHGSSLEFDATLQALLGPDAYGKMLRDYGATATATTTAAADTRTEARSSGSGSTADSTADAALQARVQWMPAEPPQPPTNRLWSGLDDSDDEGDRKPASPPAPSQAPRASAGAIEARRAAARAKLAQRAASEAAAQAHAHPLPTLPQSDGAETAVAKPIVPLPSPPAPTQPRPSLLGIIASHGSKGKGVAAVAANTGPPGGMSGSKASKTATA